MPEATVAFIGLGNMGGPMAANLLKSGKYHVVGFDPSEAARNAAQVNGIELAKSAVEAAAMADYVFTMLPNAELVAKVWGEILPSIRKGALVVDSSTIDVQTSYDMHALAAKHGLLSVDAPVSGGVGGAQGAKLTFMVGGADAAIDTVAPMLDLMGAKTVRCGAGGAGQAAKICNNMILGANIIAVSEAFVLSEKLGLSNQVLFDVASTSTGQCWALTTYCPVPDMVPTSPANNGYKPGAPAHMMLKDLRLSQKAGEAVDVATPLGKHATDIFEQFAAAGYGDEDFSAIIRYLRDNKAV